MAQIYFEKSIWRALDIYRIILTVKVVLWETMYHRFYLNKSKDYVDIFYRNVYRKCESSISRRNAQELMPTIMEASNRKPFKKLKSNTFALLFCCLKETELFHELN